MCQTNAIEGMSEALLQPPTFRLQDTAQCGSRAVALSIRKSVLRKSGLKSAQQYFCLLTRYQEVAKKTWFPIEGSQIPGTRKLHLEIRMDMGQHYDVAS